VTNGKELSDVRSVALDISSRTSAVLTKIIFREFLGFEPAWRDAEPDAAAMLAGSDAALIIGDPALKAGDCESAIKTFDLAALWQQHTGLGFVFAMWMTAMDRLSIDFASARDEGLEHVDEIIANYADLGLSRDQMRLYLTKNICYTLDDSM